MSGNYGIPCIRCGYLKGTHENCDYDTKPAIIEGYVCSHYTPVSASFMKMIDAAANADGGPGRWVKALALIDNPKNRLKAL